MISELAKNITPSATCELEGVVADLKNQGTDVIELNAGEPDFLTPHHIVEACDKAMEDGKMKYVNVTGIQALRQKICDKLKKENHLSYGETQICISTGAKQALFNAVLATVNPDDEVIIPVPGWVSYTEMVKMAGGIPVLVKMRPDYHLDIPAIEQAVSSKTKLLIINSPNNPTGVVYWEDELKDLADLVCRHHLLLISDEVYEKYTYVDYKTVSIASLNHEIAKHTIVINGFSKSFAMTGWRIGYSAAPQDIADAISAIQSHVTSNSTTMVQWAALDALENGDSDIRNMVRIYKSRRERMHQELSKIKELKVEKGEGAFYYFVDFQPFLSRHFPTGETVETTTNLCKYILDKAHVALVPGEAFFAPGKIRMAYTISEERIAEGVERIRNVLNSLV